MSSSPDPVSTPSAPARKLSFQRSDEILAEVDLLLESGYERTGTWSLGQICRHLTGVLIGSVEGFPSFSGSGGQPSGDDPDRARRVALGRRLILDRGEMPKGVRLPDEFAPKPEVDDRAEAEALRGAWRAYHQQAGPLADHPLLGPLTSDEWMRFHCVHSAHHLGFLSPRTARPMP